MKKTLSIILTVLLMLSLVPTSLFSITASAATSDYYTYTVNGGKTTITDVDTSISGDVTIPSTIGGYDVTSIGNSAFSSCDNLTSITIPDSVTSIGNYAFSGCGSLTSITIAENITKIGDSAFYGCDNLTTVNFNAINCVDMGYGYSRAFDGCDNITTVNIGDKVKSIPNYAFYKCSKITNLTIPESVTRIGYEAFQYCTGLTTVNFDAIDCGSMNYEGGMPFLDCDNITTLNIGDKVKKIPAYAFYGFSKITNLTIPESVTSIGDAAFQYCTGLTTVNFNANQCTYMGYCRDGYEYAPSFDGCINLSTLNIGDDVEIIPKYAFYTCSSLTSITIPRSVTSIGDYAFYACSSVINIIVDEENAQYRSENDCLIEKSTNKLILGCNKSIIPKGIISIGNFAFYNRSGLINVIIPSSVKIIGEYAFSRCSSLEMVIFEEGVEQIGDCAFSRTDITNIELPKSLSKIGVGAFSNCQIEKVYITDLAAWCNMIYTGSGVGGLLNGSGQLYLDNKLITNLVIPKGVERIPASAFYGCNTIKQVFIPKSLKIIDSNAFFGCENIIDVLYEGDELAKSNITIDDENSHLTNANWNYLSCLESINHTYSHDCDKLCNIEGCGFTRTTQHIYDHNCDEICNIEGCDYTRTIEHKFYNSCDTDCNECGATREVGNHKYDNACDTECNICSEVRETVHTYIWVEDLKATCVNQGVKHSECKICKEILVRNVIADPKGHQYTNNCDTKCNVCSKTRTITHTYKTAITKATTSKNGKTVKKCTECGKVASTTTIYYAKKVKLSTTEYTYNGKSKKPSVKVYDYKGNKISSNYYDVSYASGRKKVGKYKVTIKLKGNYSGTLTAYFTINPKETKVSSISAAKKSLKVKIKKVSSQASGYEIQYSTSSKFKSAKTKKVTSYKTTSVTLKSLKAKKTYYVRVRTYKTVDGKKYYSDWSSKKSKKTK